MGTVSQWLHPVGALTLCQPQKGRDHLGSTRPALLSSVHRWCYGACCPRQMAIAWGVGGGVGGGLRLLIKKHRHRQAQVSNIK